MKTVFVVLGAVSFYFGMMLLTFVIIRKYDRDAGMQDEDVLASFCWLFILPLLAIEAVADGLVRLFREIDKKL